jgi:hypothetical protein
MLIAGSARSGTTWVGAMLDSQIRGRILFEPFHNGKVEEYRQFRYFEYRSPRDEAPDLLAFCTALFEGRLRNEWIDRQVGRLVADFRLVKAIRANLLLGWLRHRFPRLPIVLLLRHPCAVVASRMHLEWATDGDIEPFRRQPALVADHLGDLVEWFDRARSPEQKHALIWCVHNRVPLRQLQRDEMTVVFYEHLCTRPEAEVPRLFEAVGHPFSERVYRTVARPSATTREHSAVVTGADRIRGWRRRLSSAQTESVLEVVRDFGLGDLYDESPEPLVDRW